MSQCFGDFTVVFRHIFVDWRAPIFVDFAKPELTAFWTKCLIKCYGDLSAPDLNIYKWCDQKLSTVNSEDV